VSIKGYIGQAGTGKTFKVIENLNEKVKKIAWSDYNAVLAITFMHGSRRRLLSKLKFLKEEGINFECQTIDSFCFKLLQRYKLSLGISKKINISGFIESDQFIEKENEVLIGIDYARTKAIELLDNEVISNIVSYSYPIIIVDEFQDCEGNLLEVVKAISRQSMTLIAADEFQYLNSAETKCTATKWLNENGNCTELTKIWRTKDNAILNTSHALRENIKISNCIEVEHVPAPQLAAWKIAAKICWNGWGTHGNSIVLLSPVSITNNTFVKTTIERLKKPFKKHRFPKLPFIIEGYQIESVDDIVDLIPNWKIITECSKAHLEEWKKVDNQTLEISIKKAIRTINLRGVNEISKEEFKEIISSKIHYRNAFGNVGQSKNRLALTIHGAKNREFDDVIIIWPYASPSDDLFKRKLLYNAVTRAKQNAYLMVQGKNDSVLDDDVFSLIAK